MLTFPQTGDDTTLPIAVLDRETARTAFPPRSHDVADGDFQAPALKEGRTYDVVVGPTEHGLFARLPLETLPYYPVAVVLERVPGVQGQVVAPAGEEIRGGEIRAVGPGFDVATELEQGGRFAFAGLPTEPISYRVSAKLRDRDRTRTAHARHDVQEGESWVEITMESDRGR